jgi:UDP-2,4-diacetamido-2,4,6-trideoxy-beta-L-altropyranose hydrolase
VGSLAKGTGVEEGTLVIRADAGPLIGTGHVMRCLALAQAWKDAGGRVVLSMAPESQSLEARLRRHGVDVRYLSGRPGSVDDALQTVALAMRERAGWVVADGYHFKDEYQKRIKNAGLKLLLIDDYGHADHYSADLVLNQNISARSDLYRSRETCTRLLLGSRYVLLRREFRRWSGWKREIKERACTILVTLGGSDPDNGTVPIVKALTRLAGFDCEVRIVTGPSNPHAETVEKAISRRNMRILRSVDDMPALMAWADMAVSAGGSTCWEMSFMGLPFLTVVLADNQKEIASGLDTAGIAENLGWFSDLSEERVMERVSEMIAGREKRERFSVNGRLLIDGEGAFRIVRHMVDGQTLSPANEHPAAGRRVP